MACTRYLVNEQPEELRDAAPTPHQRRAEAHWQRLEEVLRASEQRDNSV